eukprot:SAG25_NODE_1082_length_4091_cov_2.364729_5_plen_113_part_00
MAMRRPGPPEVSRPCRRPWIQIPILLLMKVFYNGPKRGKIGHVKIGIGLRISGRTFTHTSDKKVRPAHNAGAMMIMPCQLASWPAAAAASETRPPRRSGSRVGCAPRERRRG